MKTLPEIHAYLAGPDVFYKDAVARGAAKKAFLAKLGIVGHFPFDNEITNDSQNIMGIGPAIAAANEKMMLEACGTGRFGVILADMTPFRGPSMDVGTAFEMGFMAALSYQVNVLILGYTDDPRLYAMRLREDYYMGNVVETADGLFGADGVRIENLNEQENLMMPAAIKRTGGCICTSFEEAAHQAKIITNQRLKHQIQADQLFH